MLTSLRVFSPSANQRFISRFLVSIWMSGEDEGKKLLKRILPTGLVEFLKFAPINEDQLANLDAIEGELYEKYNNSLNEPQLAMSPLKSRLRDRVIGTAIGCSQSEQVGLLLQNSKDAAHTDVESLHNENFRIMFHAIIQDHHQPDLIWNEQTRIELREALEHELIELEREQRRHMSKKVAWNYGQFYVRYDSLKSEPRVGSIYLRPFLDASNMFIMELGNHNVLFEMFLRRILVNIHGDNDLAVLCIRCLCKLYSACQDLMKTFDDMLLLIRMMYASPYIDMQHYLLILIDMMSMNECNLEQLLDREVINTFLKFTSLSHLNPDQIGNMLARIMKRTLLIEDGEDVNTKTTLEIVDIVEMVPTQATNCSPITAWIPDDSDSPRIWLVVPPNTTLPPTNDDIRGPYKVSELQVSIQNQEITREWLVAPSASEDYADEEYDSIVDTGLWRKIEDYFQVKAL